MRWFLTNKSLTCKIWRKKIRLGSVLDKASNSNTNSILSMTQLIVGMKGVHATRPQSHQPESLSTCAPRVDIHIQLFIDAASVLCPLSRMGPSWRDEQGKQALFFLNTALHLIINGHGPKRPKTKMIEISIKSNHLLARTGSIHFYDYGDGKMLVSAAEFSVKRKQNADNN
jgi:hypothetical protein